MKFTSNLIILFLTIGIIILFFRYDLALYRQSLQNSKKIAELKARRDAVTDLEQTVQQLQQTYVVLIEQQPDLDVYLPQEFKFHETALILHEIATKNGLVMESLSGSSAGRQVQPPAPGFLGPQEFSLTLPMGGSYEGLKSFLKDIERSARIFNLESINWSQQSSKEEGIKYSINLALKTYAMQQKGGAVPLATSPATTNQ